MIAAIIAIVAGLLFTEVSSRRQDRIARERAIVAWVDEYKGTLRAYLKDRAIKINPSDAPQVDLRGYGLICSLREQLDQAILSKGDESEFEARQKTVDQILGIIAKWEQAASNSAWRLF